ncbi:hypothetical protein PtB15_1B763 [Puccinia triticina]|nr:hypothetical protein PtB15_1B763 [Puccinia triticina]
MSSSLSSNHFNEDSSSDDSTISYPDRSDFPQVLSEEDVKENPLSATLPSFYPNHHSSSKLSSQLR